MGYASIPDDLTDIAILHDNGLEGQALWLSDWVTPGKARHCLSVDHMQDILL